MELNFKTVQLYKNQTLGTGSYGAVCKALCDELPCAAKLLYPVFFDLTILQKKNKQQQQSKQQRIPMERFKAECHFLSQIKHPNIVQYIGMYHDPDTDAPVLLMELMDTNLTNFLETSQHPLQYHLQLSILHDIALALSFLHHNKIIHRDLSSNNILLNAGHRAKVSDFGMSKLTNAPYIDCITQCPGTPVYMPPEALDESAVYSEKLDCFSFGVLTVQVITRKFPSPTDRFQTKELLDPTNRFHSYQAKIHVPEYERRQNHISLIPVVNPLRQVALDCLKDRDFERPTAQQLCARIKVIQQSASSKAIQQPTGCNIKPMFEATQPTDSTSEIFRFQTNISYETTTSTLEKTPSNENCLTSTPKPSRVAPKPSRVAPKPLRVAPKPSTTQNEKSLTVTPKPSRVAPKPPTKTAKNDSDSRKDYRHTIEMSLKSLVPNPHLGKELPGQPQLHVYDEIPDMPNRPLPNLFPMAVSPQLPSRSPPPGRFTNSPIFQESFDGPPPPPPRTSHNIRQEVPPVPPRPTMRNTIDSLRGKLWYHSTLDRKQTEAKLRRYNQDGMFLVRDSSKVPGEYSLSIFHSNNIIHLRIELRADEKFTLGEGKGVFETVTQLVKHHKKQVIRFKNGGGTNLKFECPH